MLTVAYAPLLASIMSSSSKKELLLNGADILSSISDMFHHQSDSDDDDETTDPDTDGPPSEILATDYEFTALSHPYRIRLLSLQPGKNRDPIRCRLNEADLATYSHHGMPGYEALSYVWGPQDDLTRIQINESGLGIGPNLLQALVDLREEGSPRLLWVDAICINQTDKEEKNTQVPLMKDIYTRAQRTICYLGPKDSIYTRRCYDMLEGLAQEATTLQAERQEAGMVAMPETEPAFVNQFQTTPVESDLVRKYTLLGADGITDMASSTWWQRAWTTQELLLSPKPIIMTGRYTMPWEDLRIAVDYGLHTQIWNPVRWGCFTDLIIVPYVSTRNLDTRLRLRKQRSPEQSHPDASVKDFLHVLTQCRNRAAQDPRDKIYAFLGLLGDSRSHSNTLDDPSQWSIVVDYNVPVVDVYRQASVLILENLQNLDILGVCPASGQLDGKPSWVTDWSVTAPQATPLSRDSLDRERTTHATKRTQAGCRFLADGKTVVLSGHVFSSVSQLSGAMPLATVNTDNVKLREMVEKVSTKFVRRFLGLQEDAEEDAGIVTDADPGQEADEDTNEDADENADENPEHDPEPGTEPATWASKIWEWVYRVGEIPANVVGKVKLVMIMPVTVIWILGWLLPRMGREKLRKMVQVFARLVEWERFVAAGPPASGSKPGKQAAGSIDAYCYWQTVCAGTYKDGDEDATRALFQEWFDSLRSVRDYVAKHPMHPENRPEWVFGLYWLSGWRGFNHFWPYITCAQHRRLGWAEDGRLCLLPADADVGDTIILACGGRAPLVVRARGDGCYQLVGEAYIHGVMDGEAFKQDTCHDIKMN